MNGFVNDYFNGSFMNGLQHTILAIIVLVVGWIVAKIIGNLVEKGLRKTELDEKVFHFFRSDDKKQEKKVDSNRIIGKAVFYLIMLFVLVSVFDLLQLNMIAGPLSNMTATILGFIPAVLKALLILIVGWLVASAVKWAIVKGSKKLNLLHLFYKMKIAKSEEEIEDYVQKAGKLAFGVILLLFIPAVLHALQIDGLAQPVSNLVAAVLAFIPKLFAAVLVFAVGWFVAKVIRNILINILKAAGSERLAKSLQLDKFFEGSSLAQLIGNIVFILIMLPVTIAALDRLELAGITEPAMHMLAEIMNMIPNILIALVLVMIGIWLGRHIGKWTTQYLQRLGFDKLLGKLEIGNAKGTMSPSAVVGYIVQILIVFFLIVQALNLVKLGFLVTIAAAITAYLPNVLAAVLIIGAALILANIVHKVLINMLTGHAKGILAGFAKYAILTIAVFMALTQLGIASSIVTTAFTLILGGLALAFGLAFGLGGKDFAHKYLSRFDNTIEKTGMKDRNAPDIAGELPDPRNRRKRDMLDNE
ncbi:mechanosensitive ion channel [Aciduricibacillus chroicocephali]|uniref:Mechanosensitive ion channel n=1 Tax=Aciduricibacillus chroicocephali TaxID=3054939 RepID=A0ABY9KST8_9BACI|nr:mechanosensitive ion channel [Bacillaceae bacterium 44XB]